jgi:hypothetical protein
VVTPILEGLDAHHPADTPAAGSTLTPRSGTKSQIPGGVEVLLVTDDDTLLTECRASALMQRWAMEKYIQRTYRLTR